MKEYLVRMCKHHLDIGPEIELYGKERWKLVTVYGAYIGSNNIRHYIVFEREKG